MVAFARDVLGVNIAIEEIVSVIAMGMNRDGYSITKVTFVSSEANVRMYRGRVNLRANRHGNIWLNEELTKSRAHTDYLARLMYKKGIIKKNWTFLGVIYVKATVDGDPIEIKTDSDLGRFGDYLALEREAAQNQRRRPLPNGPTPYDQGPSTSNPGGSSN